MAQGPVVFLKISEEQVGEFDAIMVPVPYETRSFDNGWGCCGASYFLNYTDIVDLPDFDYNLAPRMHRCS